MNRSEEGLETMECEESVSCGVAIARLADEQKAEDVKVLDMQGVCDFADCMVIATCRSGLQLRGVANRIERDMRDAGRRPVAPVEYGSQAWLVVDYGDVVVHLFSTEGRAYYALEDLWADAERVAWQD